MDRTLLGLVKGRAASHAAAYIYAAMKQWHLLQFMNMAATSWAEDVVPGFDASKEGAAGRFLMELDAGRWHGGLRRFAHSSVVPAVVAQLLGCRSVRFFMVAS